MKRKKHGSADDEAAIDMTPMLDIVFIMLIFFIVTTSFVKEKGLEVLRPKDSNTPPPETTKKSLAIRVNEDGTIVVNGREVDIRRVEANIQSFLAENNQDTAAVQAHPKAKHGLVTEVINEVKKAGIDNVSVLVGK
ncbi:ExbD/TolR family protein [Paraglaciecola hydrolytica]|uniref:Biopolymer transporter ExbD n=1 Tax=Paraglaciecola hydrolytica TaxID=1799789 RepID=A0A136A2V7_9ALTE|nr:biopolymer transporter ExbD [Paraglaciecola hydrolytica]KXI29553.1 biopolymer transporter ExbD [Paraglaciecola hydrolytica]